MPLRKKLTLIPNTRHPHDDYQWSILFVIMMPNTVGAIARAVGRNDYSLAALCISVFVCFFLLQFCLSKYLSLPKNEKSSQKFWLKLNMWFLYTAISFGFVYQFADFFPPQMTVTLYGVVTVCSSFLFYVFVIVDLVKYWKIWRNREDEHRLPESRKLYAGKLKYQSVSIYVKV
ncbi:hypothetical protein L1987_43910 [Smallanthus sonchifolius]|uniref:Uncharacterized protein n=1 Tax=Smallanthus sonchifolius TaxID=185202 RepID=A0ACB9GP95_9ASTR|nr:hypothetical protein L1987_43910 [Smallanthus sonchifolius]